MRFKIFSLLSMFLITHPAFSETSKNIYWKILNTSWENNHELAYQQFVHILGVGRKKGHCRTLDQCLRSPTANPHYYNKNPKRLKNIFSDCADLPFTLRAYFAWMNDLPFSYPSDLVEVKRLSRDLKDIRYSKYGNIVTAKSYVRNGDNINSVLQSISDTISTASFRTNAANYDFGNLFRDTYPVDIDRKAIVPGTVLYDPNGHVAVVYDITSSGKILMIDAHPDNSLSAITYGEKFARGGIRVGGGFSNFRPFSVGQNRVFPKSNAELSSYSLIQFQKEPFIYKGKEYTFYDYVRVKLADGDVIYNPIREFRDLMDELCLDTKYREEAVNTSLKANLQNQMHPEYLPENIYGADGDWEAYATPGRDASMKASVKGIKSLLTKVISSLTDRKIIIDYPGNDLVRDLREIYFLKAQACTVRPNQNTVIDLDKVLLHLFDLSFDPYHCAELRWGLPVKGNCTSNNKMSWYRAEQGLRNRVDRDTTIKTNYDVRTLPSAPASQVPRPDLSFDKLLEIAR